MGVALRIEGHYQICRIFVLTATLSVVKLIMDGE